MISRSLVAALSIAALLLAACSGGGNSSTGGSGSSSRSNAANTGASKVGTARPGDVKAATDPVRVIWASTKYEQRYGLINASNPAAKKPIPLREQTKVISDEQMGALLAYFEKDLEFFELATPSFSARNLPAGRTNGYISIERGGRTYGLIFLKGMKVSESRIPVAYTDGKKTIIGVFNASTAPQAYTSRPGDKVLGIDRIDNESGVRK